MNGIASAVWVLRCIMAVSLKPVIAMHIQCMCNKEDDCVMNIFATYMFPGFECAFSYSLYEPFMHELNMHVRRFAVSDETAFLLFPTLFSV